MLDRELMGKIDRGLILHLELEDYVEVWWKLVILLRSFRRFENYQNVKV